MTGNRIDPLAQSPLGAPAPVPERIASNGDRGWRFVENLPLAVYMCAPDGTIVRYNRRAAQLWGREPQVGDTDERFCGSHRLFLPDGTALPHAETPMARVLRTRTPARDQEVVIERPDGSRLSALVNIDPLFDEAGAFVGAVNCFQDITHLKRVEDELRRNHADLEDFFENSVVGLHWVAEDGTILRANKAELDLLGYEAKDYVGRHIADFHVDDFSIEEILSRVKCGERLDKYPARLRAKDGSIKHVLISSSGQFRDGRFVNTRCFTLDVTGWHEAEEARWEGVQRLAATYEHAGTGILEVDREGRLLRANEALSTFTGFAREELLGRTFVELTSIEDRHRDWSLFQQQIAGEIDRYEIEKRFHHKDGRSIWALVTSSAVRDGDGRFLYGVRVVQDITERKRAEARQQLQVDEMNHRIKNLLGTVQAIASQTGRNARSVSSFLERFEQRLSALSRANALMAQGNFEWVDIRALIEEELRPYDSGDGDRVSISGSRAMLNARAALTLAMTFHELATNAGKYGALSQPAGRLHVSWEVENPGSSEAKLYLRWQESGGPPLKRPDRKGFGLRMIERSIQHSLDGSTRLEFDPAGLVCEATIPLVSPRAEPQV